MSRKWIILGLLLISCLSFLQAESRYVFYENFEGVYYPPGGWTMNSSDRVQNNPHGGRYDVEMNADTDYMITPLLANLNNIKYWHKNNLTDYQFTLEYAYSLSGPWITMPGYPRHAGTNWTQETVLTTGLNNIYIRFQPIPTAGSTSILIDDVEFDIREEQTPVELSSFTAVSTAAELVSLTWVAQSETNHMGYFILRNEQTDMAEAIYLNSMAPICFGQHAGTQITYNYTDDQVDPGSTYYYWLESVDLGGQSQFFGPIRVTVNNNQTPEPILNTETALLNAFPNPFNPDTTIPYYLEKAGSARIEIYNLRGELVWDHTYSQSQAGYFKANWDGNYLNGREAASGVYYYRMTCGSYSCTKKMLVMK